MMVMWCLCDSCIIGYVMIICAYLMAIWCLCDGCIIAIWSLLVMVV